MRINYNITGEKRKSLVNAISQELNVPVKYLGAPTFAYEVGGYRIDRNGMLEGADNKGLVADLCGLHSFVAVTEEYDTQGTCEDPGALKIFEDLKMTEEEELGLGKQHRDQRGEDGMQASDVPASDETCRLVIEMPLTGFTPEKIDNLIKLVNGKALLLKAALGTEELPIQQTADTLKFPWFSGDTDADTVKAYTHLITALCDAAKKQCRVNAVEKIAGNEKYAFRCFLLKLGFIGDTYKAERKVLISRLEGSSSYAKPQIDKKA